MIKKVAMVAISAIIGVLLVVTVLTPILMGATSETLTTRNTGSFFAAVSDDDTEHTIIISAGTGSFVITTDDRTDITPSMGTYNPGGVYVADAIGLGIYQGYNNSGVLVSQSGKTPTSAQTINVFRTEALAGNSGNTFGTYQLINMYQALMDKIMSLTVLGNTDATYMMGTGTGTVINDTGLTTAPYTKSADNTESVSIFLENTYGNGWTMIGDSISVNYILSAGNTLGGKSVSVGNINNVLTDPITIPTSTERSTIDSIYVSGNTFGIPKTTTGSSSFGTPGEGINDTIFSNAGNRIILMGGNWNITDSAGLFAWDSNAILAGTSPKFLSRLAYVMPELDSTTPTYGYVVSLGTGGNTVTGVQALVDGVLTDENPTGTTLNSFWNFDTTTGIGPFGSYYALINLSSGANTDDETEPRLSTVKGEIAYILNPADWTETLAGNSYTASEYNAMLIVPTMYWGVSDSKLYMSNSPNTFNSVSGLEMKPYAHTYTVDPSVDTGNPVTTASATVVYGEDYIVRLYSTGDVYLITTNAMTYLGQASGENTVELTVTGDVLGYTPSGGSATTIDDVLAYIASTGKYVQCKNPMYSTSQEGAQFIIGGYANNLTTTTDDVVDIGYCLTVDAADLSLSTITVLNPVSDASNTVDTNGAVWGESTLIKSDLYKVGDLTITTTWSDTGKSVATYNYYLAPEKVVYKNPNYLDNGPVESILNVLPIIIVAGLLLGILSMIVVGKLKE